MCELAGCPNVRDRVDPYKGDLSYSRTTFNAAVHPLTLALLRCSVSMAAEIRLKLLAVGRTQLAKTITFRGLGILNPDSFPLRKPYQ